MFQPPPPPPPGANQTPQTPQICITDFDEDLPTASGSAFPYPDAAAAAIDFPNPQNAGPSTSHWHASGTAPAAAASSSASSAEESDARFESILDELFPRDDQIEAQQHQQLVHPMQSLHQIAPDSGPMPGGSAVYQPATDPPRTVTYLEPPSSSNTRRKSPTSRNKRPSPTSTTRRRPGPVPGSKRQRPLPNYGPVVLAPDAPPMLRRLVSEQPDTMSANFFAQLLVEAPPFLDWDNPAATIAPHLAPGSYLWRLAETVPLYPLTPAERSAGDCDRCNWRPATRAERREAHPNGRFRCVGCGRPMPANVWHVLSDWEGCGHRQGSTYYGCMVNGCPIRYRNMAAIAEHLAMGHDGDARLATVECPWCGARFQKGWKEAYRHVIGRNAYGKDLKTGVSSYYLQPRCGIMLWAKELAQLMASEADGVAWAGAGAASH